MSKESICIEIGAHSVYFETGQIARQANGAVVVRCGETVVFSSACAAKETDSQADFFPLRVDYQEKFSAAGKTLGGFIKREGRPTEKEVLVSRLIDRPLRPMFEKGYQNEVQVLSYVWSYDPQHMPDVLAICAASAAVTLSDIPLIKPIAAVRVGKIGDQFVVNPTEEQMTSSSADLIVAGTADGILMIEGSCRFLTEAEVASAVEFAHIAIAKICGALSQWQERAGKAKKRGMLFTAPKDFVERVRESVWDDLISALRINAKEARDSAISGIRALAAQKCCSVEDPLSRLYFKAAYSQIQAQVMREMILSEKVRCDGRALDEIRPIIIEPSLLPRAHGSCLFTRGETQALAVCTLGGEQMSQRYESLNGEGLRRFYLQYSFPPYSVGETGRIGAPGRREVGHGKLAERALEPLLPPKAAFPYTVRIESNITESNGSSSMASVCGGCLAMMDAGIPIERPIAGIAMGLIFDGERTAIISDILGVEDALGDMDFKIAADRQGITALQMDIKVEGLAISMIETALQQAKAGCSHILNEMAKACPTFRQQMSPHAPRIEQVEILRTKIATIIGPGGKQIRAIEEETGTELNVVDAGDSGLVSISANNSAALAAAKKLIEGLVAEIEIGKVYQGKVKSIAPFGAFVEILPGKEGLCHISELANRRVESVEEICKVGDDFPVLVKDINERGQIKLSHKATLSHQGKH